MGDYSNYNMYKQSQYKMTTLPKVEEAILNKLLTESEKIWKLLKYIDTDDPLSQPDLTMNEKLELIEFTRSTNESEKPLKFIAYQSGQITTDKHVELRIYPFDFSFDNKHFTKQMIRFELMAHYDLKLIKNGRRLIEMLIEIIRVINHLEVDGMINSATFDNTDGRLQYFNEAYTGYTLDLRCEFK